MFKPFIELWSLIGRFFNWWFGELGALVPGRVRSPLGGGGQRAYLDVSGDDLVVGRLTGSRRREVGRVSLNDMKPNAQRSAVQKLLRKAKNKNLGVALRIGARQVLRKTIELPLAAEENLREVLGFEMDRHTPFKPDEVYYDFRVLARDNKAQRLSIDLGVAPRRVVDEVLAQAEPWDVAIDRLEIAEDAVANEQPLNFLPPDLQGAGAGRGAWVSPVLALAACALAAIAVYLPLERQEEARAALAAEVRKVKAEAEKTMAVRDQVEVLRVDGQFVVARKNRRLPVVRTLNEITRVLPDNTWLIQLQINNTELQLSGYSSASAQLIGLIDESPILTNPKFRSSVTQDARVGRERFQISASIRPDGK